MAGGRIDGPSSTGGGWKNVVQTTISEEVKREEMSVWTVTSETNIELHFDKNDKQFVRDDMKMIAQHLNTR